MTLAPAPRSMALLLTGALACAPAARAQDAGRFVRWSYADAGALARSAAPRSVALAVGGAAILGVGMGADAPLLDEVQAGYHGPAARYLDIVNPIGGPRAVPVVAGVFAATLATDNARLQDAAFTSFQALAYAGAVSYGIKAAAGRMRPTEGRGARRLRPFSGHSSFPSGHTTQAFAVVTPWVYYYPGPATYGLLALSTGTAVARVARGKHWPSDVVAGAALGFLTARSLARRHLAQETPSRLRVEPVAGADQAGVVLRLALD